MLRRDLLRSASPLAAGGVLATNDVRAAGVTNTAKGSETGVVDIVRDFEADPKGVVPSDRQFARAFATGRPIYVPPGTYSWESSVSPPTGARCFADRGTAVIKSAPSIDPAELGPHAKNRLLTISASDVFFDGLTFDGNALQVNSHGVLCMVYGGIPGGVDGVIFEHCTFRHVRGITAFFATNIRRSGLRDCTFVDCGNYWRRDLKATAAFQGLWNAARNLPELRSGVGTEGYYYAVSAPGGSTLDGVSSWSSGDAHGFGNDIAMFIDGRWIKRSSHDASQVIVFGQGSPQTDIGNFVVDCNFADVSFDVISAYRQKEWFVAGNRIDTAGGINNFTGGQGGIGIEGGVDCSIIGNVVYGCAGSGSDCADTRGLVVANNVFAYNGITGLAIGVGHGDVMSEVVIANNVCLNNHLYPSSMHEGGITLAAPIEPGTPGVLRNLTITGNVCTDTQTVKTQRYGLHIFPRAVLENVWIDQSNSFAGNLVGEIGGHAIGYSTSRAAPVVVTGSRTDGSALRSTLAALVKLGLVQDNSTL
jgi:hypothetical protein